MPRTPVSVLLCLLLAARVAPGESKGLRAPDPATRAALDLVDRYCLGCHDDTAKGGVDLSPFATKSQVQDQRALWLRAAGQLDNGAMPPEGKRQPSPEERQQLVEWIGRTMEELEATEPSDPGPTRARRLTREEYANTVAAVFGVGVDIDLLFPADPRAPSGFENQSHLLVVTPELMEKYLLAADRILDSVLPWDGKNDRWRIKTNDASRRWIGAWAEANKKPDRAAAEETLDRLLPLAYRRPHSPEETAAVMAAFDRAGQQQPGFMPALRAAVKAVLVSPQFLFRTETEPPPGAVEPADPWELASRLSYFLWSGPPDDELARLAASGELRGTVILRAQARRLIKDGRSAAFASAFTRQWLFGRLVEHPLDRTVFPEFTPELERAALQEVALFWRELLISDRPLTDLIDADSTFANAALAQIYGVKGLKGPELRKIDLPEPRGGLLGMAAVLQRTSMSTRTSPSIRGKWILDAMLGTPPPPPPPTVVNTLDTPQQGEAGRPMSFREKLARHSEEGSSCKSCHRTMDPLGFAMENFDALGRFRETDNGEPVDARGQLPDGTPLHGVEAVRAALLARQPLLARNLASQLMTYALGRDLENGDLPSLRRIADTLLAHELRAGRLVEEVVVSHPFRHKRGASDPDRTVSR